MDIEQRWQQYQEAGLAAVATAPPATALEALYLAILAFSERDLAQAAHYAAAAAWLEPTHPVCAEAARYLAGLLDHDIPNVYTLSDGFAAFIRGGGNLALYRETSAALRAAYAEYPALRLLDIGAGDGMALLPAIAGIPNLSQLDVVEPAAPLLSQLRAALEDRSVPARIWNMTIQEFSARDEGRWDLAQATYSLQSLAPADLAPALAWLRHHTGRLLIVEFNEPQWPHPLAPQRVRHIVERYTEGLAEYDATRDLVAQGFLMPVMFGYFDPTAARTNYERSAAAWADLLKAAGFAQVEVHQLFRYWWAPAVLIDAR